MALSYGFLLLKGFADTFCVFCFVRNARAVPAIAFNKLRYFLINLGIGVLDDFQQSTAPFWLSLASVTPRT